MQVFKNTVAARQWCIAVSVLVFSISLPLASATRAATLQYEYHFDSRQVILEDAATLGIRAGTLPRTWEKGQPEIPYDYITLLVPRGSRVTSLRSSRQSTATLLEGIPLPMATPRRTDAGQVVPPPESQDPSKAAVAPAAEVMGMGMLRGYQVLTIRVHPLAVEGDSNRVVFSPTIRLEIDLASDGAVPLQRERLRPQQERQDRRLIARLVDNPEALAQYELPATETVRTQHGFRPTQAPSLEGSPVDYLVITSSALEAQFQVLADWKTQRGVPAVVRTIEWIQANTRHGSDLQETIRNFLQEAYTKWGVEYVVLGGDTDVIPARYGYSAFGPPTEQDIPTDMYFACLDGNWNLDGDALWGEAAINAMDPGDDTDLYAEVYVGRLPVSTSTEAANLIDKIIEYEDPTDTGYQDDLLMLAEVLFPVGWEEGDNINQDGAQFSEDILTHVGSCTTVKRLYQNHSDYPGSMPLTHANSIAALNEGPGIVNHIGHGFRYNMSVGDKSIVNADAAALTNGDRRFLLYMLNCTATAFDFPCLAEAYLKSPGGAVAVLGSSRAAFALPAFNYNQSFFQALYEDSVTAVGRTFVESRLAYTPNAWYDTSDHYSHFLYNMLADPEMQVHTCSLQTTAATFPSTLPLGETAVMINVTTDGLPRQGARVCLQKETEEYVWGLTDTNGDVTLPFVAESAGSVHLTISGPNMTTLQDSMQVDATSGAYVHVTSMTLDDDSAGASTGNGDGAMDSGETIELSVDFRNDGNLQVSNVGGVLRSLSPQVTVLDSMYSLGTLAASGTANSTALRVVVDMNTPDGTVVELEFETTDGLDTWNDVVAKVVLGPVLELTFLEIDDSAPGGNGDGVIQAGETFDVIPSIKNYGRGAVDQLSATLLTSDPDLVLVDNHASFGAVVANEEKMALDAFRVTENTLENNTLLLFMVDSFNRVYTWGLNFRIPATPAAPILDASQGSGVVVATWTPSVDADLAGYHLYRAESATPPSWTRVTQDHTVRVAYFRDQGLSPSTEYFYYVTAVDSSGNESDASPVSSINTQPAQMSGWPILVGAESSCPPAVGDVTGDGSKEIVVGNNDLYAWDWQGVELLDGDQDPQTWGVFVDEINVITGAIVLAEATAHPGFEIFATVWSDGNKTYLVDGDGSVLSGWPQNPDSTSSPMGYWASPSAADVDGDGFAELFATGKNGNLYAWHADGSPLGVGAAFKTGLGTWTRCSPSFADLDGDPFKEIVYGAPNGTLHVWNADGSTVNGFPVSLGSLCISSTAIGDVNNDGVLDIVMITDDPINGAIHVIDSREGTELSGWPVVISNTTVAVSPSPALADFDFDGYLEIVVANNHSNVSLCGVSVYDHQGVLQPGWPQYTESHTSESSPIVADVSGDGIPDILFGNENNKIYGWDKDGNSLFGFPLTTGDFVRSTPFADDIDADGDIDLVLSGWDKNVYVWDFTAPLVEEALQWRTLQHDAGRSGRWGNLVLAPTDAGVDQPEDQSIIPSMPILSQNEPNPFNPMTTITYGVPQRSGPAMVRLDIYDVQGRLVRQLVRGRQTAGTRQALWDGRDERGRRVQSGVYFYRLQVDGHSLTRKMTVLK
jgi:hypothetical protein